MRILRNLAKAMFRWSGGNISCDNTQGCRLRALRYALCLAIAGSLALAAGKSSPKRETPPPPPPAAAKAKAAAKKKAPAKKAAAPAKNPAPKAVQQSATQDSPSPQNPEREHETAEFIRRRAEWFQRQRAYPFQHIPPGALQKAIQQRDLMKQQ